MLDILLKRRSIRKYKDKKIEEEKLSHFISNLKKKWLSMNSLLISLWAKSKKKKNKRKSTNANVEDYSQIAPIFRNS